MSLTTGLQLPFGIQPTNPVPVDSYYGPYNSVSEATTSVPLAIRYLGRTVGIIIGGKINDYWWFNGLSDSDLIPKGVTLSGGTTGDVLTKLSGTNGDYAFLPFPNNSIIVLGDCIGSTLRCGNNNIANNNYSTVSGGLCNTNSGLYSVISGGCGNNVTSCYSTVSGGLCNMVDGYSSFIGSGWCNSVSGAYSTISGGCNNTICTTNGNYSNIGGGLCNTLSNCYSNIGGGHNNNIIGSTSNIGGGSFNTVSGNYSTISGGRNNMVCGNGATIAGGYCNTVSGYASNISGGGCNTASNYYSKVGGGFRNTASGYYSIVGGGRNNTASGLYSTIINGTANTASDRYSFIGNGSNNNISGCYSGILSGSNNTLSHCKSFIIGSNITSNQACTTFVNDLQIVNKPNINILSTDSLGNVVASSSGAIVIYSPSTQYNYGNYITIVSPNDNKYLYFVVSNFTSSNAINDTNDTTKLKYMAGYKDIFQSTETYYKGQLLFDSFIIYQCLDSYTNSGSNSLTIDVDAGKWKKVTLGVEDSKISPSLLDDNGNCLSFDKTLNSVTGDNITNTITSPNHGLSNGTIVKFNTGTLVGGAGIVESYIYYVINSTLNTFKLSLIRSGAEVNFTTDITAGDIKCYWVNGQASFINLSGAKNGQKSIDNNYIYDCINSYYNGSFTETTWIRSLRYLS